MPKLILFMFFTLCTSTYAQKEDNRIYFSVDELATYQGGYEKFNQYISDNINCKIKINRKDKNEVQIRFIVEKNSEIKGVEILSTKPFKCKDEIIAAIKSDKNWKPALKNNIPVRSIVQMNVNFLK